MAERTPADVINAHHDKLNEHTAKLEIIQDRIDALDGRMAEVEMDHQPLKDFMQRMNDWVGKIKDLV